MRSSNTNLMSQNKEAGRREFFFQYLLLFVLLIFSICQYSIHRLYGFTIYPDEFGYWANAAQWIGYDWSGTASLSSYYSFGYSMLLAPILRFCTDSVTAYRAAVSLNMVLQCISVGLLWSIFRRLKKDMLQIQVVFATGIAVFYPAWIFYTQMTLSEALLTFLYALICYQMICLLEDSKVIGVLLRVLLLLLSFLYSYFVHMRTVGVVAAAVLVLGIFLWQKTEYRKLLICGLVVLTAGVILGVWLKGQVRQNVYTVADVERLAGNDYAGQVDKIKRLFSFGGMLQFLQSCAGKFYYLGIASFGLFYPAVVVCIKRTGRLARNIRRKSVCEKLDWFHFFLLCSMLGQIVVTAIYTGIGGRLDGIVYGRYNEYLLPLFMGVGVLALMENEHPWKLLLGNIVVSTLLFGIVLWCVSHNNSTSMYGFFITGLSHLLGDVFNVQAVPEFLKSFFFGLLLMIILTICVCFGKKKRRAVYMMCIVLLMEILLTLNLNRKYTWPYNSANYYDLSVYEYIEEYEMENTHMPVRYLYGGGRQYIDLIQFAMLDEAIEIIRAEDCFEEEQGWKTVKESLPQDGFLIVDYKNYYLEEMEQAYQKCAEGNNLVLFLIQ